MKVILNENYINNFIYVFMFFLMISLCRKNGKFSDMFFFNGWIYDFFNDEIYDLVSLGFEENK